MKKLFVLVLLASFAMALSGNVWAGAKGTGMAGDYFGQGKFDSDPQRSFRLVRFHQGEAPPQHFIDCEISKDSVVCWNLTEDDGVTVMLMQGGLLPYAAGVLATTCDSETTASASNTAAQDIGKDNWAWMQTYGKCTFLVDANADVTEGEAVGTGPSYGTIKSFISSTTAGAANNLTGSANGKVGFVYDGAEAGDNVEGFVRLE